MSACRSQRTFSSVRSSALCQEQTLLASVGESHVEREKGPFTLSNELLTVPNVDLTLLYPSPYSEMNAIDDGGLHRY
jgi:hypothetical protein